MEAGIISKQSKRAIVAELAYCCVRTVTSVMLSFYFHVHETALLKYSVAVTRFESLDIYDRLITV